MSEKYKIECIQLFSIVKPVPDQERFNFATGRGFKQGSSTPVLASQDTVIVLFLQKKKKN